MIYRCKLYYIQLSWLTISMANVCSFDSIQTSWNLFVDKTKQVYYELFTQHQNTNYISHNGLAVIIIYIKRQLDAYIVCIANSSYLTLRFRYWQIIVINNKDYRFNLNHKKITLTFKKLFFYVLLIFSIISIYLFCFYRFCVWKTIDKRNLWIAKL